jgi:RNA polymerase sigma-70 factor (ECF subfamily)
MIGPERLGALFDAHAASLVLFARQWCDAAAAEDVVQEAFLSLARQRETPSQVAAWLYRVVRNGAISAHRRATRRRRREGAVAVREAWFATTDDRIDAQQATRLLEVLPLENREAIVARTWGGLSFEQVAGLQGCSTTTAFRRYRDGLALLQERMGRPCPDSNSTTA